MNQRVVRLVVVIMLYLAALTTVDSSGSVDLDCSNDYLATIRSIDSAVADQSEQLCYAIRNYAFR